MAIAMSAEEAEKYDAFVVSYNPENLTVNPATVKEEERLDADMRMDNDRLYLSVSDAALKAAGGDLESSAQTDGARVVVLVFSAH